MLKSTPHCRVCGAALARSNWPEGNRKRRQRLCAACGYRQAKSYAAKNRAWAHGKNREYRRRLKVEVLTHYGGGRLACVNCGFSDLRALTIDHVANDGAAHRKTLSKDGRNGSSGSCIYTWLKKHGHPSGFQTLCMNCNFIKAREAQELKHAEKMAAVPPKRKWTRNNPEGTPIFVGGGVYRYNGRFCGRLNDGKRWRWVNLTSGTVAGARSELVVRRSPASGPTRPLLRQPHSPGLDWRPGKWGHGLDVIL